MGQPSAAARQRLDPPDRSPRYNQPVPLFRSIGTTLEMIKWEHSVLTLPFG